MRIDITYNRTDDQYYIEAARRRERIMPKEEPVPGVLFGKLGKVLIVVALFSIVVTAYFLPLLSDILKLSMPAKWAPITRLVIQITIGSWVATVLMSIARVIVWLRAVFHITTGEQYTNERSDVTYVRDFTLWFLGIMTALAVYMIGWLSG